MRGGSASRTALLVAALAACSPAAPTGTPPPPAPPTAELWIGGDLTWGAADPAALLAPLAPLLDGAVGFVNVEGPLAPLDAAHPAFLAAGDGESERYVLRNDPAGALALSEARVRVAGTANNHRQDAGDPATTDAALRSAGLRVAGDTSLDVSGVSVAFSQVDLSHGVPDGLAGRLATAGDGHDVAVVAFHVVGPPSYLPRPELRAAVDIALAAGADVVVAHGTHALGPVERRGDAVVAWGLGNLAMTCPCTTQTEGLILRVGLTPGARPAARVLPIAAGLGGEPARPSPDTSGVVQLLDGLGVPALGPGGVVP